MRECGGNGGGGRGWGKKDVGEGGEASEEVGQRACERARAWASGRNRGVGRTRDGVTERAREAWKGGITCVVCCALQ